MRKTLSDVINEMETKVSPLGGEMLASLEKVLSDAVKKSVEEFKKELDEQKKESQDYIEKKIQSAEKYISSLEPIKGDKGDNPTEKELESIIKPLIPRPIRGEPGLPGEKGSPGKDGVTKIVKSNLEISGEEIVKKINALDQKPIHQIDPWHVKGETKYEKQIHGGGDTLYLHDLSASLDGSTKVFTIPRNTKITLITSSSAPFFFRPTVDYTLSGTGNTILTFDSALDATVALAQGQSIGVQYTQ